MHTRGGKEQCGSREPKTCMHRQNNKIRRNPKHLYVIPKENSEGAGVGGAGTGGTTSGPPESAGLPAGTGSAHAHRLDVLGLVVQQLAQLHGCLLSEPQDPVSRSG